LGRVVVACALKSAPLPGCSKHPVRACYRVSDRREDDPNTGRPAAPNLITHVATTAATVPDVAMTEPIHDSLNAKDLLPGEHVVDAGYTSADLLLAARGIVVQLSFLSRPVCLPVLARLWRPRHTGKIAHARQLAELIATRYPDRRVHVVGDAAYVGERLRDVDARITWTSRLKVTSVLHELPPPRTGRSGRPRTRGARLGTPTDLAADATAGARWRTTRVRRYGVPTPYRSPNWHACGTDRFAVEPCGSFWSATTSRAPATETTAVMAFRWSPPISNLPRRIWWLAMPHGGESSRHSPMLARSWVWVRPAIGHPAPWNRRFPSG
jgi:hypothetical protein